MLTVYVSECKNYLYTNEFSNKSLSGENFAVSYFRPTALDNALDWLVSHKDGRIAAGCTDLYPETDRESLDGPILDLTAIPELKGVVRTDDG